MDYLFPVPLHRRGQNWLVRSFRTDETVGG